MGNVTEAFVNYVRDEAADESSILVITDSYHLREVSNRLSSINSTAVLSTDMGVEAFMAQADLVIVTVWLPPRIKEQVEMMTGRGIRVVYDLVDIDTAREVAGG